MIAGVEGGWVEVASACGGSTATRHGSPRALTPRARSFARQVDEVVSDALRVEILRDPVDAAALAERREVDAHARGLARAALRRVDFDLAPAHTRARRSRWPPLPAPAASPDRDRSPRDSPAARPSRRRRRRSSSARLSAYDSTSPSSGVDVDPLAAVVIVEAAQRRVGAIGAEREVHGIEPRLHAGAQSFGGRGQSARDLHRPGAAHGLPGQQRFTHAAGCVAQPASARLGAIAMIARSKLLRQHFESAGIAKRGASSRRAPSPSRPAPTLPASTCRPPAR